MHSVFRRSTTLGFCICIIAACSTPAPVGPGGVTQFLWPLDNLEMVGGQPTTVSGDPQVARGKAGSAVVFDGDGDRLLVAHNPLAGAEEFTIEVVFRPADCFPENIEPRFFHIEGDDNPDRRVTVELRLTENHRWYLDAFIKSEASKYTLADAGLTHPVSRWAHAAVTYRNRVFTSWVNGERELSAEVDYLPIAPSGKTSIGARMNQVNWFNGAIAYVAISHKALQPAEFALLQVAAGLARDDD